MGDSDSPEKPQKQVVGVNKPKPLSLAESPDLMERRDCAPPVPGVSPFMQPISPALAPAAPSKDEPQTSDGLLNSLSYLRSAEPSPRPGAEDPGRATTPEDQPLLAEGSPSPTPRQGRKPKTPKKLRAHTESLKAPGSAPGARTTPQKVRQTAKKGSALLSTKLKSPSKENRPSSGTPLPVRRCTDRRLDCRFCICLFPLLSG